MIPTRPIDAALVAWVQDETKVREFIEAVRRGSGSLENHQALALLAIIAHRDAQLAAVEKDRDLREALADLPPVARGDRLTPEQRAFVEMTRERSRQASGPTDSAIPVFVQYRMLLAILDQHCPRPAPEGHE